MRTNNNNITAQGFTFYPPQSLWWPNEPVNVFEIDGQARALADPPTDPAPDPVSEPSSLILVLMGLAALLISRAWRAGDLDSGKHAKS